MEWFANLPAWMEQGAYFLIFFALFLSGIGLPVPEEISFLLGGYLAEETNGSLGLMIVAAVAGVLLGDVLLFVLARRHGEKLLAVWPFRLLFTPARLVRGRRFFANHGSKTIFLAGFFAGIRATVFFMSSTMGVRFSHFLFWDSVRTLLTCPISIWVGYRFGTCAKDIIEPYKELISLLLALVIAVLVLRELIRRRRLKARGMIANGRNAGTRNAV